MSDLLRALRYFRPSGPGIFLAFALLLLSAVAGMVKPWPLAVIVDSVLGGKALPGFLTTWMEGWGKAGVLGLLSISIFFFHAVQGLLSAAANFLSIQIGLGGLERVRNEVFGRLQRLSLRFHQGSPAGEMIYRASWDTCAFQTVFQQGLMTTCAASLTLLFMLGVMWGLSGWLTVATLALAPPLVLSMRFFGSRMGTRATLAQETDSKVTSLIQQNITALPLVQSYTAEGREAARFATQVAAARERRREQHGWEVSYGLGVTILFALGAAMITWLGGRHVLEGRLTLGELLVFLAYLGQLYDPLNQLSHVGTTVAGARAGMRRVFELLDEREEVRESPKARPVVCVVDGGDSPAVSSTSSRDAGTNRDGTVLAAGNLAFDRVSFGYTADRLVLRDLSFKVKAGQAVALIGPSGAGKTTLLQLIPRFFDPNDGAILLEGVDLRELRMRDLRRQVALVLQEPILLPATLGENIAYGRPEAISQEIEAAARAASAHDFIAQLPDGYETLVGEGAARLSVGEKQRINLARAFLKNAPILLLDEPTSALDAESEEQIVASLRQLMKGRTTFIVAHRLATIRDAQKIIVLENRQMTEFGGAEELSARSPYFRRLLESRSGGA